MILQSKILAAATTASLLLGAYGAASTSYAANAENPQKVTFSADTIYPESVTWSVKQNSFFVSSVRHGTVGKVSLSGKYVPFIKDDKLISSVGLLVDDARNTLWVTNSDPGAGEHTNSATQGKLAGVAKYDATTGQRRAYYDLSSLEQGAHLANDIALDDAGNLYVTDSFAPIIYRIGVNGRASIFSQSKVFNDAEGFNLNGVAWHKDGYLLVGKYNSGELFRVSIKDPAKIEKVALAQPLKGADGFHLIDKTHLVVVQNLGTDRTVELTSSDGWKTAQVVRQHKSALSMPTAAAQVGGDIYVLNSRLDTLFDPKAKKVDEFTLEKF
jgi:sugar lactone lactonase YvrE